MSSVYKEITLTLTEDEKKILKPAIELCKEIASDCNDEDMFVDASTILAVSMIITKMVRFQQVFKFMSELGSRS